MEKDRKKGQNGKDGMRRPRKVSRKEYESNFEEWLRKVKEAKTKNKDKDDKQDEEE